MTYIEMVKVKIQTEKCPVCGVHYGLEEDYINQRYVSGKGWHCPNGCRIAYTKSKADLLQEENDKLVNRLEIERARYQNEKRSHSATKGQLTKTKKRVGGGVCPCCNRQFSNLRNHMNTQHPDYTESEDK